jgi:hypothetical protein
MLAEALSALAAAGGTALVGAMATDAWQTTRDGIGRLFGRGDTGRRTVIEAQLDEDAETVAHTEDAEREQARQELVLVWRRRLVQLLEEQPDTEAGLRDLIARVQAALPPSEQAWVQTNIAHGGNLFAVQGGSQKINYHGSAARRDASGAEGDGGKP